MRKTKKLHLGFLLFWCVMIVPTLTIWKESILLILLMSLYANIEATATAYLSAGDKDVKKRHKIKNSSSVSHRGTQRLYSRV